ncbi:MAG: hypothetical protein U9R56_07500, partial [candidate division Zixibacteria bacterium]|nr:hypothetical protein [candidate division Zixibacteria bacterium]
VTECQRMENPINNIRIITSVTTNYMREMDMLPESLKRAGLKHTIFRYYDSKTPFKGQQDYKTDSKLWIANVNHKPYFLLNALDMFREKFIIWTDWDSEIVDKDWLVRQCGKYIKRDVDVVLSQQSRKMKTGVICDDYIGGTIILKNTSRARWFLGEWITAMENVLPDNVDQTSLNRIMDERHQERMSRFVSVAVTPKDFVQLSDNRTSEIVQPAILHQLASRRHNALNGMYGFNSAEHRRDAKVRNKEIHAKDNIIYSDFEITSDSITIVGAAKSADGHFHRVPDDSFKVACNISILQEALKFDCWLSLDDAMPSKGWFNGVLGKFKGAKIFRRQTISPMDELIAKYRAQGHEVHISLGNTYPKYPVDADNVYWMYTYQGFIDKTIPPIKGVFRHGGTVASFALQLGWYYGIKKFYLIGVEMKGNQYHVDNHKNPHHGDNEIWNESIYLQTVIDTMKADGCEIYTLSPTALNLQYPPEVKANANIRPK